jgi:hypothetical protein
MEVLGSQEGLETQPLAGKGCVVEGPKRPKEPQESLVALGLEIRLLSKQDPKIERIL